jgi:hypothetical protein
MSAISRPQVGKLFAVLSALGVTDRDDRIRTLRAVVYRQIGSTNDLTFNEAKACIDVLSGAARRDDPAAYLARLVETAEQRMPG